MFLPSKGHILFSVLPNFTRSRCSLNVRLRGLGSCVLLIENWKACLQALLWSGYLVDPEQILGKNLAMIKLPAGC